MDNLTLTELIQWAIGAALAFYSYNNETVRILGLIVGIFCLVAVLVRTFITTGLFPEEMFLYGVIVLGACYLGRKNDIKHK